MQVIPRWLRVAGKDAPAQEVLRAATPWLEVRGVGVILSRSASTDDYTQIDPELESVPSEADAPPQPVGYAGLSPEQRGAFRDWAGAPESSIFGDAEIPNAWRYLYCANLEVALLERSISGGHGNLEALLDHIATLAEAPAWRADPMLARILMLAMRLTGDGSLLRMAAIPPAQAGSAFGLFTLASEDARLTPEQAVWLTNVWRPASTPLDTLLIALRLEQIRASKDGELLQRALVALPESARAPTLFRMTHRDLRLTFPQPDLRPTLEPLLDELLAPVLWHEEEEMVGVEEIADTRRDVTPPAPPDQTRPTTAKAGARDTGGLTTREWLLVLEFAESRSQYAHFALDLARRQTGYTTLLDEDRTIIHRVFFRKGEMRRFWRLWEYVQGWSSTRVYLNGEELQKWQVWPWSQVFR